MQKFFTDKSKVFECNLSIDGAALNETKARLILEFPNNRNLMFHGKISANGKCEILVPALKELKESKGNAILEVIAESTYFESWKDKFELKTDKKVQIEVVETEKPIMVEEVKPIVSVIIKETEKPKVLKEENIVNVDTYSQFKKYLRENKIGFNSIIKTKQSFINVLHDFKSKNIVNDDGIKNIVEGVQSDAILLKS